MYRHWHYKCIHLPLVIGRLASGNQQFVGMNGETANLACMAAVVPLNLIVHIVEHHDGGNKVDYLAGGQQEQIVSAVLAPVAVPVGWLAADISTRTIDAPNAILCTNSKQAIIIIHTPIPV